MADEIVSALIVASSAFGGAVIGFLGSTINDAVRRRSEVTERKRAITTLLSSEADANLAWLTETQKKLARISEIETAHPNVYSSSMDFGTAKPGDKEAHEEAENLQKAIASQRFSQSMWESQRPNLGITFTSKTLVIALSFYAKLQALQSGCEALSHISALGNSTKDQLKRLKDLTDELRTSGNPFAG